MKIGILGGGQLARMLMLAGAPLGLEFVVYAEEKTRTTQWMADHIIGRYDDECLLDQLMDKVDVITYESENIPYKTAAYLHARHSLYPSAEILRKTQDRYYEKNVLVELGIPTNEYYSVDTYRDFNRVIECLGFPFLLKSRVAGYDGKHQFFIQQAADLDSFKMQHNLCLLAEEWIAFEREISVIGARDRAGDIRFYDICQNEHRHGMLHKTENAPRDPMRIEAYHFVKKILNAFDYVGVMAVEFFVKDHQLIVNEIAPRVHNSGHWTIEGAFTSQFENHIRAIAGLSLGLNHSYGQSVLLNCITKMPNIHHILKIPGAYYHDYLKQPKLNRKLGHVTLLASESTSFCDAIVEVENALCSIKNA